MASVYEIKAGFYTLTSLIEDEAVSDDVILDAWNNQTDDLKDKFENCCKYLKNVDSDIAGLDEEIKRLQAKKRSLKNGKDRLKKLMFDAQMACGEKKLQCGTFTTTIQKNPPKLVLDVEDVYLIPDEFLKYAEPEVKSKEALDAIKAGATFTWCHSVQEDSLRIR